METKKVSKKALKSLLNDSMRDAIGRLQLPEPTKRVNKLIDKSSKRLASEFTAILKKQTRKENATEKAMADVEKLLSGKKHKKSKKAKIKSIKAEAL